MDLVNILEFLAFVTGLVLIKKINTRFLYVILAIVGYAAINDFAAFLYSYYTHKFNMQFYVIYSIVSFTLFFLAIKSSLQKNYYINAAIVVFILAASLEIVFKSAFSKYFINSMYLGCSLIIFYCFIGFIEILNEETEIPLQFNSRFWFLAGTVLFHFLLLTYIFVHDNITGKEIQRYNKYLLNVANYIFYPFMTIAFLCQLKKTN